MESADYRKSAHDQAATAGSEPDRRPASDRAATPRPAGPEVPGGLAGFTTADHGTAGTIRTLTVGRNP